MLICIITVFAGTLEAEVATDIEMERVCENWLSLVVKQNAAWAGAIDPKVVGYRDILGESNRLLARCFYISPSGYVVVPVLKELPPVKAYSDKFSLDVDQREGIPELLREVLQHRTDLFIRRYGSLQASQPSSGDVLLGREHRQEWDRFTEDPEDFVESMELGVFGAMLGAGPLLSTSWGQGAPFNNACPMGDGSRCKVGCVAIAAAQVLKYHAWPPAGTGTYSYIWNGDQSCGGNVGGGLISADFSDSYDWSNMPDSCDYGCSPTEENALAELCYEVGVAFDMDYGACGSGTYTHYALSALPTYFGYDLAIDREDRDQHTATVWFSLIQSEIDASRPLLYRISRHAIVCDGWRRLSSLNQYHMNYGWGGRATAWYTVDGLYCDWEGCNPMVEYMIRNIEPYNPTCSVSPPRLDFGVIGTECYRDTAFYLKNIDSDSLFGDISESCDHYSIVSGGGPYALAAGESIIVTVRYEPTETGTHECMIETGESSCRDVQCTGEANLGCLVRPLQLDFGIIAMGDSVDLDFTIYNIGCDTLFGSVYELLLLHYSVVSGGGSYAIPLGDSLVVTVRFKPTRIGICYSTVMTGANCLNVKCRGVSFEPPPACLIDPDTLDFGNVPVGDFKIMTFDITNTGYGTLTGNASGSCPYYVAAMGSGSFALTHDQTRTVSVLFFPGSAGTHTCTIETGNETCSDVFCSGIGKPSVACLVQPDTLEFGAVCVNDSLDMTFFVTNTGGDTLQGSISEICDQYSIVNGGGPFSLAANETLFVGVQLKPTSVGSHNCTIDTGDSTCIDVVCTGTGDPPSGIGTNRFLTFALNQNYPNPFNPTTTISFALPEMVRARLAIFDLEGKLVRTLVDEILSEGVKHAIWDGKDARGNPASSGVYFYRLKAGDKVLTKKMVLLK